jgi:hypothetical protein
MSRLAWFRSIGLGSLCPIRQGGGFGLAFKKKGAANCGGLRRGDKTLRTPAFPAFVDVMHEARLFFLNT